MAALGVSLYPHGLSYTEAVRLGKLAEDRGFDSVFVVEGGVDNDAMAQAIALGTQRIVGGRPGASAHRPTGRRGSASNRGAMTHRGFAQL